MSEKRGAPPWSKKLVHEMEYQEAVRNNTWGCERDLADRIMKYVNQHNLMLKLDKLTRGHGNCYPVAVLQQIRREDIFKSLGQDLRQAALTLDHLKLRNMVSDYILSSNDVQVNEMRLNFIESMRALADIGENIVTWQEYWNNMRKDGTWAESYFVQATSYLLNVNIEIVDTSGNARRPTYFIESGKAGSQTICLGLVTGLHYQSLIKMPVKARVGTELGTSSKKEVKTPFKTEDKTSVMKEVKKPVQNPELKEVKTPLKTEVKKQVKTEVKMSVKMQGNEANETCPVCMKNFVALLTHLNKNQKCQKAISKENMEKAKEKSEAKAKAKRKELNEKKRAQDPESARKDQNQRKKNSRERKKADESLTSVQLKRTQDPESVKKDQNQRKKDSRERMKATDEKKYNEDMRVEKAKQRKVETAVDQLRLFREATICSAVFICISCHTKQFKSNVQEFSVAIEDQLVQKNIPLHELISDLTLKTKVVINESPTSSDSDSLGKRYICSLCLKNLKAKKLTGRAVMNNLQLYDTDAELIKDDLMLTELEGSLVAKNIIFQKIFLLPRS